MWSKMGEEIVAKGTKRIHRNQEAKRTRSQMAKLYWNQKLREGKQSPGRELERFSVGGRVTSAGGATA